MDLRHTIMSRKDKERQKLLIDRIKRPRTDPLSKCDLNVAEEVFRPVQIKQEVVDNEEEQYQPIEMGKVTIKSEPLDEAETSPLLTNVKTEPIDEFQDFVPIPNTVVKEENMGSDDDYDDKNQTQPHGSPIACVKRIKSLCNSCSKYEESGNLDKLKKHLLGRHHLHYCDVCEVVCGTEFETVDHIKSNVHQEKMMVHLVVASQGLKEQCPLCPIDTKAKINDLRIHIDIFHANRLMSPTHTCYLCRNKFQTIDIHTHTTSDICLGRRICYYCHKKCRTWEELQSHLADLHKIRVCSTCDLICGSKIYYDHHITSEFHMYMVATADKQHLPLKDCPVCPLGTTVRHLQFHLRLVHSDILKNPEHANQCVICKKFVKSKDLLKHDKACLGVKALEKKDYRRKVCQDCGTVFLDAVELGLHSFAHMTNFENAM